MAGGRGDFLLWKWRSGGGDVYDIPILGTVLLWTISYFILLKEWVLDNYRNLVLLDVQLERIIFGSIKDKKHALMRVGDLTVTMAKMNLLFVTAAVAFPFLARRRPHD
ncbi:hypothetical protein B0H14DRAFT_2845392 [Mycena olivaceomarginata]|nr:hypothetical protein B0H14DRAFT_2845392 [Mycena olivaceomarginata]